MIGEFEFIPWCDRVRAVRRKLGLTQKRLAEKIHVSKVTIALWEARSKRVYSPEADRFTDLENEVSGSDSGSSRWGEG